MTKRTCSVEGCEQPLICRGFCKPHYKRAVRAGLPVQCRLPLPEHCAIEGCPRRRSARGMCNTHFQRWLRYGDPLHPYAPRFTLAERVWQKVEKAPTCWLWTGYIEPKSRRGKFHDKPMHKSYRAYRLVYELVRGPIPEGLVLDHLCSNPTCVRPDHLEAVTQVENRRRQRVRDARPDVYVRAPSAS